MATAAKQITFVYKGTKRGTKVERGVGFRDFLFRKFDRLAARVRAERVTYASSQGGPLTRFAIRVVS